MLRQCKQCKKRIGTDYGYTFWRFKRTEVSHIEREQGPIESVDVDAGIFCSASCLTKYLADDVKAEPETLENFLKGRPAE